MSHPDTKEESSLYGLLADFERPEQIVDAVKRAREVGYRNLEAYTPYPIDELSDPHSGPGTWVPAIVFLGGLLGLLGGFFMQYYAAVIDYPLNVGGRPLNSWPSFVPVTFELTVLLASLCGLIGMLALNGLPLHYHPLFNVPHFDRASRDRFFLCIEATDPKFDRTATEQFLRSLGPLDVAEVPP